MGPEDKTTEIELPARRATDAARSNIVHVNFSGKRAPNTSSRIRAGRDGSFNMKNFTARPVDRVSPWMIRVIALVSILLLSLLVL